MPLYDFACPTCGDFEEWRTMAESSDPVACPTCEQPSQRVLTVPNISLSSGKLRMMSQSSEPQLVQRPKDRPPERRKYQSQAGGRPWMVSH